MRIARFTTGQDPVYGLVDGAGEKIAEITGDPLYQKILAALPEGAKASDYITRLDISATKSQETAKKCC